MLLYIVNLDITATNLQLPRQCLPNHGGLPLVYLSQLNGAYVYYELNAATQLQNFTLTKATVKIEMT